VLHKQNWLDEETRGSLEGGGLEVVNQHQHEDGGFTVIRADEGIHSNHLKPLVEHEDVSYVEPNYKFRLISPIDKETEEIPPITEEIPPIIDKSPKWDDLPPNGPGPERPRDDWFDGTKPPAPEVPGKTPLAPVIVAVFDTGIDHTHQDLQPHMWTNPGEIPHNGIDDDGNGYVDDVHGWNFYDQNSDTMDVSGHGTNVAGIIIGVRGIGVVEAGPRIPLMAIKISRDMGTFSDAAQVVKAIDYAVYNGAAIVNYSGTGPRSEAVERAIGRAQLRGVLFIAAAGNEGRNIDINPRYPASYQNENIISVSSTDRCGRQSNFSNFGARSVDLGATGENIFSTTLRNWYAWNLSGTSIAAPYVTRAAALLWQPLQLMLQLPQRTVWRAVEAAILNSAIRVHDLYGKCVTGGMLNHAFLPHGGGVSPPHNGGGGSPPHNGGGGLNALIPHFEWPDGSYPQHGCLEDDYDGVEIITDIW